jgi:hypothetical protein
VPLCGTTVSDGAEPPPPGRCPGCGARFAGDAERPEGAAAALLAELAVEGVAADRLARRLFEIPDGDPLAALAAITSDRRRGFYRWWAFVRADDGGPALVLGAIVGVEG